MTSAAFSPIPATPQIEPANFLNLLIVDDERSIREACREVAQSLGFSAFIADSAATIAGAVLGTSTVTSYIESAAGVRAGGRTGLVGVVVAALFLLSLFLAPLAGTVPAYATAPALFYVACLMTRGLAEIDWEDVTEYAPAVVAAVTMPLTFSIANGIAFGLIAYAAVKLLAGRFPAPAVVVLAALFLIKFTVL